MCMYCISIQMRARVYSIVNVWQGASMLLCVRYAYVMLRAMRTSAGQYVDGRRYCYACLFFRGVHVYIYAVYVRQDCYGFLDVFVELVGLLINVCKLSL